MTKKILFLSIVLFGSSLIIFVPFLAKADVDPVCMAECLATGESQANCTLACTIMGEDEFPGKAILDRAQGAVFTIFGAVASIMFIWAGILFVTSAGKPESLDKAKKAFIWGIIGVVVGLLSASIFSILNTWLTT